METEQQSSRLQSIGPGVPTDICYLLSACAVASAACRVQLASGRSNSKAKCVTMHAASLQCDPLYIVKQITGISRHSSPCTKQNNKQQHAHSPIGPKSGPIGPPRSDQGTGAPTTPPLRPRSLGPCRPLMRTASRLLPVWQTSHTRMRFRGGKCSSCRWNGLQALDANQG
jgi:hypothetical protein